MSALLIYLKYTIWSISLGLLKHGREALNSRRRSKPAEEKLLIITAHLEASARNADSTARPSLCTHLRILIANFIL